MLRETIGISDMAIYVPPQRLPMATLVQQRSLEQPNLGRHLERALRVTGQSSLRFPAAREDTATMAAEAAHSLLIRLAKRDEFSPENLRYLVAGTESGLDHSKPLSAYVSGMLSQAGHAIPKTLSNFQVQHACAGATLAAISVAGLLAGFGRKTDSALVLASDIARYQTLSTAEVTQGAGAAAILLTQNPDLLELDLDTMGFSSEDVDDFFRPLGSVTAQVNGRFSMECYQKSLETAFADHAQRANRPPADILNNSDVFVLHAPFAKMPIEAMNQLLATHLGLDTAAAADFLAKKGFFQGLEPVAQIGNTYTASVFIVLAWVLRDLWRELGPAVAGKRVLLASYGSGNTMVVMSARIAPRAPSVLARWDLDSHLNSAHDADWQDYLAWTESSYADGLGRPGQTNKQQGFVLDSIRPDGYRVYDFKV